MASTSALTALAMPTMTPGMGSRSRRRSLSASFGERAIPTIGGRRVPALLLALLGEDLDHLILRLVHVGMGVPVRDGHLQHLAALGGELVAELVVRRLREGIEVDVPRFAHERLAFRRHRIDDE